MKNKIITVISIIISIIFMLPVCSMAAEFYTTEGYYENPSFYGIFDAIYKYGDEWLDTELPRTDINYSSNQQSRTHTGQEIWSVGCHCLGHRSQRPWWVSYETKIYY